MKFDYSRLKDGPIETPQLRLQTLAGKDIGIIPWAYDVELTLNYSDVSEIQFSIPYSSDGMVNPMYDYIDSYKRVYTDSYGIFVLSNPTKSGDGFAETKTVRGYSLEKMLEKKRFSLEEGTYAFWSLDAAAQPNTVLGRILECVPGWSVGDIDEKMYGRYRTFDEFAGDPLSFLYSTVSEKYRCAVVFDVYEKTISVYDSGDNNMDVSPIYLSYENLVKSVEVNQECDDLVTRLYLYGADNLNIRQVNPTGEDYIVDLSYFIENGDLDIVAPGSVETLVERVNDWMLEIASVQDHYSALIAARSGRTAEKLMAEFELAELKSDLDAAKIKQNEKVQLIAKETNTTTKAEFEQQLAEATAEVNAIQAKIDAKSAEIESIQSEMDSYGSSAEEIVLELRYENFFTDAERALLDPFLIDGELQDDTFVATSVSADVSGGITKFTGDVSVDDSEVKKIVYDLGEIYTVSGGKMTFGSDISGDIVNGTIEPKSGSVTMSVQMGSVYYGGSTLDSAMVTVRGILSNPISVTGVASLDGIEIGTGMTLSISNGQVFLTSDTSDFQEYSVSKDLYNMGIEAMKELAHPIYEFSIESGNFLYQKEFAPFRDRLVLGRGIHLMLGSDGYVVPRLIGLSINFEDPDQFTMTFANRFQRRNGVEYWQEVISKASSATKRFEGAKYKYDLVADQASEVSKFISGALDSAKNTILCADGEDVQISGSGIHIGSDDKQIRIVRNMIAMTDDGWQTAKVGIGEFSMDGYDQSLWGMNAQLLAGNILIGNELILENPILDENGMPTGNMRFKIDSTGAWLNNSTMVFQRAGGGTLMIDPKYGIVAGPAGLYDVNGTNVIPSFIDEDGDIMLDKNGMPDGSNFFLDIETGNAYFRGTVYATDGEFSGELKAATGTFSGDLSAATGTFKGTVQADRFLDGSGNDMMKDGKWDSNYLDLGNIVLDGQTGDISMTGNIDLGGNITLSGNISWGSNSPVKYQFSVNGTSGWHDVMTNSDMYRRDSTDGGVTWGTAYQFRGKDGQNGSDADVPSYIKETYIDAGSVSSPAIRGGIISGARFTNLTGSVSNPTYTHYLDMGDSATEAGMFRVWNVNGTANPVFAVSDHWSVAGMSLHTHGRDFLSAYYSDYNAVYDYSKAYVVPRGVWDFSSAETHGIYLTFS